VWLFLVTQASFLKEAANPNSTVVPRDQIAQYTNLQRSSVDAILNTFLNAPAALQQSFNDVAGAFQDLCNKNSPFWEVGECPHDATPMLRLAANGAAVDPSAEAVAADHLRRLRNRNQ
jgi:hypothetical protein